MNGGDGDIGKEILLDTSVPCIRANPLCTIHVGTVVPKTYTMHHIVDL